MNKNLEIRGQRPTLQGSEGTLFFSISKNLLRFGYKILKNYCAPNFIEFRHKAKNSLWSHRPRSASTTVE